jgi:hypothetical protein
MKEWNKRVYQAEILMNEGKNIEAENLLKEYENKYQIKRINEVMKI